MIDDTTNNYISLKEAEKYCNYSQEYLSLRTRQGELKAVKIGRNWVTKKEWLEEYLVRMNGHNGNHKEHLKNGVGQAFLQSVVIASAETDITGGKDIYATLSEHQEKKEIVYKLLFDESPSLPVKKETPFIRFALVAGLALVLLFSSVVFVKIPTADRGMSGQIISAGSALKDIGKMFNGYISWLEQGAYFFADNFKKIPEKIAEGYNLLTAQKKEEMFSKDEITLPQSEKTGMVVVPSTGNDEKVKEDIRLSFSDEVKVKPADNSSGIVIPIFRKGEGGEYMYVLVPIKN